MGVPLAVAGLVGAGVSAYGQYEAGRAASTAAAYRAQVAANNAEIARRNATMDIQAGEVAATNKGLQTRALLGKEKAGQAASGVDVNTGSAASVRAGTQQIGMLDALSLRSEAANKAYGQQVTAASDTAQGQLDTLEGQQAAQAGEIGSLGTLLSGASTVGANYASWKKQFGDTANFTI